MSVINGHPNAYAYHVKLVQSVFWYFALIRIRYRVRSLIYYNLVGPLSPIRKQIMKFAWLCLIVRTVSICSHFRCRIENLKNAGFMAALFDPICCIYSDTPSNRRIGRFQTWFKLNIYIFQLQ